MRIKVVTGLLQILLSLIQHSDCDVVACLPDSWIGRYWFEYDETSTSDVVMVIGDGTFTPIVSKSGQMLDEDRYSIICCTTNCNDPANNNWIINLRQLDTGFYSECFKGQMIQDNVLILYTKHIRDFDSNKYDVQPNILRCFEDDIGFLAPQFLVKIPQQNENPNCFSDDIVGLYHAGYAYNPLAWDECLQNADSTANVSNNVLNITTCYKGSKGLSAVTYYMPLKHMEFNCVAQIPDPKSLLIDDSLVSSDFQNDKLLLLSTDSIDSDRTYYYCARVQLDNSTMRVYISLDVRSPDQLNCQLDQTGTTVYNRKYLLYRLTSQTCQSNPCINSGTCKQLFGTYQCLCTADFTGAHCETRVLACASQPCQNGGTCKDLAFSKSYMCNCVPGYNGERCQFEVNECLSYPCKNGAKCQNLIAAYQCICIGTFYGTNCDDDFNDCLSKPCDGVKICQDLVGSYKCVCPPGYTGAYCEAVYEQCTDITCFHNGICVEMSGGILCYCPDQTTGSHCETIMSSNSTGPANLEMLPAASKVGDHTMAWVLTAFSSLLVSMVIVAGVFVTISKRKRRQVDLEQEEQNAASATQPEAQASDDTEEERDEPHEQHESPPAVITYADSPILTEPNLFPPETFTLPRKGSPRYNAMILNGKLEQYQQHTIARSRQDTTAPRSNRNLFNNVGLKPSRGTDKSVPLLTGDSSVTAHAFLTMEMAAPPTDDTLRAAKSAVLKKPSHHAYLDGKVPSMPDLPCLDEDSLKREIESWEREFGEVMEQTGDSVVVRGSIIPADSGISGHVASITAEHPQIKDGDNVNVSAIMATVDTAQLTSPGNFKAATWLRCDTVAVDSLIQLDEDVVDVSVPVGHIGDNWTKELDTEIRSVDNNSNINFSSTDESVIDSEIYPSGEENFTTNSDSD